ncbi:MAG: FecR family protein [Alphaproteobacteria bacterium]
MQRLIGFAALFATLFTGGPALAVESAGQVTKVIATARAQPAGQPDARLLQVRDPVFMGDLITTNQRGQAQFRFMDDTRLVVGPNSRLSIDSFVFASRNSAADVTINAVRGAFRFLSGRSSKQAYTINFLSGSIGVRGTEFDLLVDAAGVATIALYGGGLRVCDRSSPRRCAEITQGCTVLRLTTAGEFSWVQNVVERTAVLETEFPYAFRQSWLAPQFRVQSSSCAMRAFHTPGQGGDAAAPGAPPPPPPRPPPPKID